MQTLADVAGGLTDKGGSAVGLVGTIPVIFEQGNETRKTMALAGQPLSEVAAQAGQYIKYKCGKGECCLLYTSPSPRDRQKSRMPSSA